MQSSDDLSEKDLDNAINFSQVFEFTKKMEDGVNTIIGDRGTRISGVNNKELVLLELYKNPEILILDESTSSLDVNTEEKIINDVLKLENIKTLIIVSHRASTIQKCKVVYELKGTSLIRIK